MADVTKAIKFLLTTEQKGSGFKGLGKDLMQAVKSGQGLSGVKGVLKNATKEAGGLGGMVKKVGIGFAAAGVAAVAAGAAIAIKFGADSVNAFKKTATEVLKVKRLTGETAEESSRLNFAFKQTGVDSTAGAKALGIFSKNLAKMGDQDDNAKARSEASAAGIQKQIDALKEAGPHTAGYKDKLAELNTKLELTKLSGKQSSSTLAQMGIDYRDANGNLKPMSDLLPSIAEKFKNMPDGANKTALAMKLFGKSGTDLLPFLNKGAAGLKELADKSDAFGNTLNDKQLQALKDSKQAQKDWDAAMQGLQVTLGANLLPLLTTFQTGINSAFIPAIQGATHWIQENQGAFDAMGKMMTWVWNNVMIPLIKVAIIGFVEMNKPIANAVVALGKLTGNKDMENFGTGLLKMGDDAENFANNLRGIPDVKPTIAVNDKATHEADHINTMIQGIKDKIVKATAKGDDQGVRDLNAKLDALEKRKTHATIVVGVTMDKSADQVTYKVGSKGTMKFMAAAGGAFRSARMFNQADGVQYNEPDTKGESYIPHANDWRRPNAIQVWRRTGRVLGQFAGGGMLGGSGSVGGGSTTINLHVYAAPGQQPLEVWQAVRDGLISLKNVRYSRRELGLA